MQPSNQDKFCEALSVSKTDKTATDALYNGDKGDDIMNRLFLVVLVVTAMAGDGTYDIALETSDDAAFGTFDTKPLAADLAAADLAAGTFAVKNATLPRGLKRYYRLAFTPTLAEGETMTTAPAFTAMVITGRDEPLT